MISQWSGSTNEQNGNFMEFFVEAFHVKLVAKMLLLKSFYLFSFSGSLFLQFFEY
tara:strand:- start:462 stop:626 length:165 start_codon:yes stop_codon:yes gene_type:complete